MNYVVDQKKINQSYLTAILFLIVGIMGSMLYEQIALNTHINPDLILIICMLFTLFGLLFCSYPLLFKCRPQHKKLIINDNGICCTATMSQLIPWSDIKNVKIFKKKWRNFLVINVRDNNKYLRRVSKYQEKYMRFNSRRAGGIFIEGLGLYKADPADILEACKQKLTALKQQLHDAK